MAYTERRRGEHKSSTLALRSPDDIFPPRGNFLFGDEESCQATSTPLAASIRDDPALIANRLQLRDKRKQLEKKGAVMSGGGLCRGKMLEGPDVPICPHQLHVCL